MTTLTTGEVCAVCLKSASDGVTIMRCGACKSVTYCSKDHQKADWPKHKLSCKKNDSHTTASGSSKPATHAEKVNKEVPVASKPVCYEIRATATKGMGLFATRDIKKGECILSEAPLVVSHDLPSCVKAINALSDADKQVVFALHDAHSKEEPGSMAKALSIYRTNAVALEDSKGSGFSINGKSGLFPIFSRINHSCLPNCNHYFNPYIEKETVHALRDITSGEEIVTSYIELMVPSKERQVTFANQFEFKCECVACKSPNLKQSDERRVELRQLNDDILKMAQRSWRKTAQMVERAVTLLAEEGLQYPYCANTFYHLTTLRVEVNSFYYDAFQACVAFGCLQEAKSYARKAYDAAVVCRGENSELAKKYKGYAANPKSHYAWGLKN